MTPGLDFDALLETLAERVASKVAGRLPGPQSCAVQPRLLSVDQAGVYVGRTKEAVQHMIAAGKLPTVRSDRRVQLDVRDLDLWIEENKQATI